MTRTLCRGEGIRSIRTGDRSEALFGGFQFCVSLRREDCERAVGSQFCSGYKMSGPELILDGRGWESEDDVYDSFFSAVRAPKWHGRNFDALNDSIGHGSINGVEVPYLLAIKNYDMIRGPAKEMTDKFFDLIHKLAAKGCPVQIRMTTSSGRSNMTCSSRREVIEQNIVG